MRTVKEVGKLTGVSVRALWPNRAIQKYIKSTDKRISLAGKAVIASLQMS
ncbi:hypothetical protein AALA98_11715 [Lachnospiraceae bacterium 45-W7]